MIRPTRTNATNWTLLWILLLATCPAPALAADVEQYDVTSNSPSKDFHGAVPLGNGDIGVSAWAEENGDLLFYISKTDAYDDNHRLLKLGRVRVKLTPNPFAKGLPFRQELKLRQGELVIQAGKADAGVTCRLWVDANQPVLRVEIESKRPVQSDATLECWRTSPRNIDGELSHSDPLRGSGQPTIQYPDVVLNQDKGRITWYHHNSHSAWPITMKLQGLESTMAGAVDPLLDRTFGGAITGDPPVNANWRPPRQKHLVSVHVLTRHPATPAQWLQALEAQMRRSRSALGRGPSGAPHVVGGVLEPQLGPRHWAGPALGRDVPRLCLAARSDGLRGARQNVGQVQRVDLHPALRKQRSRLSPLGRWGVVSERASELLAVHRRRRLRLDGPVLPPLCAEPAHGSAADPHLLQTRRAFFPETQLLWGAYANADYGWDRGNVPLGLATNSYITYYWSGSLELVAMMLDEYDNTRDPRFLKETLLPLAAAVLEFYNQHWKHGPDGKLLFEPAASLETWHTATNPLPEIAALRFIIPRMLALPADAATEASAAWRKTLADVPEVPARTEAGKKYLLPAEKYGRKANVENPELYAVFPYRLYGLGKAELPVGIETFNRRQHRENRCWWQCDTHAAYLGLTATAANNVLGRLCNYNTAFAFPAMWGPHNDEIPDMDHRRQRTKWRCR